MLWKLPTGALILVSLACSAQNLVPNPSFDNFTTCPVGFSQFNGFVSNWVDPNTATPDYMNTCASPNPAGVPRNGVGWQQTHSGAGYAGGYMFSGTTYREFVQVQLTSPLVAGTTYDFHMYVVLHNKSQTAIDDLGACLTVNAPTAGGTGMLAGNPQPQVSNGFGNVITDTLNWTLLGGSFVAVGGERWLTIGHFKTDALTTYQALPYGNLGAYYYFDDVYLAPSVGLPVELLDLSAVPGSKDVLVKWMTASEHDNAGFEVQRSSSLQEFDAIGWIDGQGNSVITHQYMFDDMDVRAGTTYYYRLRQVDLNGGYTYSPVVTATIGNGFHAYALDGLLTMDLPRAGTLRMELYDPSGRILSDERSPVDAGTRTFGLDALFSSAPPGLYMLRLDLDGEGTLVRLLR